MSKEKLVPPHHAKWTYDNLSVKGYIGSEDLLGLFYEKSDRDAEEKTRICDLLRKCRSHILSLLRDGGIISQGDDPIIYSADCLSDISLLHDLEHSKILSLKRRILPKREDTEMEDTEGESYVLVVVKDLISQLRYQITKGGAVNVILDPYDRQVHVLLECFERFIKSVYKQNNVEVDRISPKTFIAACIAEEINVLTQQKQPEEFIER